MNQETLAAGRQEAISGFDIPGCFLDCRPCGNGHINDTFIMEFEEDGSLYMSTTAKENDFFYDEIGSYLKIKQMRQEQEELFSNLEEYYRAFFAGKEE